MIIHTSQVEKYKESIKLGHGVIVVAHSQGNLFTAEAFDKLEPWMRAYFHTVAVATPAKKIPNKGNGVTFYNDMINLIPNAMDNKIDNINKHDYYDVKRNALGEIISQKLLTDQLSAQYHGFEYYLGYPVYEEALRKGSTDVTVREKRKTDQAKKLILTWLYDEIVAQETRDSQWKIDKKLHEGSKEFKVKLIHKGDPEHIKLDFDIYPFNLNGKLYQLKNTGDYVLASFGGEKILDADYDDWENKSDEQFYKLEGTDPVEYIQEEMCKDPSLFEIVSQENKNTADWRVSVKNKETNETIEDVYPFNLKGSLYQLDSGEWVLASCGGKEIVDDWDGKKENEILMLNNSEKEKILKARFERDAEKEIVIDYKTGLEWQDEEATWLDSWYGGGRHCEDLLLGGYDDWRVPTFDELVQIVDPNGPPYIYDTFEHLGEVGYWTLDKQGVFPDTEEAKVVNFKLATWILINTSKRMNTRCVRTH